MNNSIYMTSKTGETNLYKLGGVWGWLQRGTRNILRIVEIYLTWGDGYVGVYNCQNVLN